jgi:hypothetical protein
MILAEFHTLSHDDTWRCAGALGAPTPTNETFVLPPRRPSASSATACVATPPSFFEPPTPASFQQVSSHRLIRLDHNEQLDDPLLVENINNRLPIR